MDFNASSPSGVFAEEAHPRERDPHEGDNSQPAQRSAGERDQQVLHDGISYFGKWLLSHAQKPAPMMANTTPTMASMTALPTLLTAPSHASRIRRRNRKSSQFALPPDDRAGRAHIVRRPDIDGPGVAE